MKSKNQSLERGIAILELLHSQGGNLGVREIGRRLALSPTIVQRLVASLVESEYILKDEKTQKYSLGYRALALGSNLVTEDKLLSVAIPLLAKLAQEDKVNVFMSTMIREKLVYISTMQSSGPIVIRSSLGSVLPFHSTAMGKVFLSEESETRVKELLGAGKLEAFTDKTITTRRDILNELKLVRNQGYATSIEENLPGVVAAGSPVRNANGELVAAVSFAFAPVLQPEIQLSKVIKRVVETAAEISQSIGCPKQFLKTTTSLQVVSKNAS